MAGKETRLNYIRGQLGVSQETIARRTRLITATYRRAENGLPVRYSTAMEILQAINSLLKERGMAELSLDDLGLILE